MTNGGAELESSDLAAVLDSLQVLLEAMQAHNEALRQLAEEFRIQNFQQLQADIQTLTKALETRLKPRDPSERLRP